MLALLIAACSLVYDSRLDAIEEAPASATDGAARDEASTEASDDATNATDALPQDASGDACVTCGDPATVISGLTQAAAIAVDDANVYWTEGNRIRACTVTGCKTPKTLAISAATALASDGAFLYWGDATTGSIVRCATTGCTTPETLASNQPYLQGPSFDGTTLAWATLSIADLKSTLHACEPSACASPRVLATGQDGVYALGLASLTGVVAWRTSGPLRACPASTTCADPTSLASTAGPGHLAAGGGMAVWETRERTIVSCSLAGCQGMPRVIGTSAAPGAVATDGILVAWYDGAHVVYVCPIEGCAPGPRVLARDVQQDLGGGMVFHGPWLYFTTLDAVIRVRVR